MSRSLGYVWISLVILGINGQAYCGPIHADMAGSTSLLGNFEGSLSYSASSGFSATLEIVLMNTTAPEIGGFITAFALNNSDDAITGATLSSTSSNFDLIGDPSFQDGVGGTPFGQFDFGASIGGGFQGGGNPSGGIGIGGSATFTFSLTGTNLDALSEEHFFDELSTSPGDGAGTKSMVVRFRGMSQGGSDKVPIAHAPAPSSLLLVLIGACGWMVRQWRR